MTSLDTKQKFVELRANNESYSRISTTLGVSKTTLIEWAKEFEYEIQNQRSIYYNALLEQYKVGKQYRVQLLGDRLKLLIDEASKRDLSVVPTVKLFEMIDNTMQTLAKEEVECVFTEKNEIPFWEPETRIVKISV